MLSSCSKYNCCVQHEGTAHIEYLHADGKSIFDKSNIQSILADISVFYLINGRMEKRNELNSYNYGEIENRKTLIIYLNHSLTSHGDTTLVQVKGYTSDTIVAYFRSENNSLLMTTINVNGNSYGYGDIITLIK